MLPNTTPPPQTRLEFEAGAKLPVKLTGLLFNHMYIGITNTDRIFGWWQNYSLPFFSKTGNSRKTEGDISYLCNLRKVLNVICALYQMSIQKIMTAMKKKTIAGSILTFQFNHF